MTSSSGKTTAEILKPFHDRANQAEEQIEQLKKDLAGLKATLRATEEKDEEKATSKVVEAHGGARKWYQPLGGVDKGLKVFNSLTNSLVPFIPKSGNTINWYSCGPTVYDDAHMGHARAYVTFDIVRRIIQDYFHYDINFVMNITDVDDKIIKRARQAHFLDEYSKATKDRKVAVADINAAFEMALKKKTAAIKKAEQLVAEADKTTKDDAQNYLEEQKLKMKNVKDAFVEYQRLEKSKGPLTELIQAAKSEMMEKLDSERKDSIDSDVVKEHCERWSKRYEGRFLEDMKTLNVRDPDVITRVSEYVDNVITYTQRIIDNGFGYESNGSVYFNIQQFSKTHEYAKNQPASACNLTLLQEGEGSLAVGLTGKEKHSDFDFALWKKSKSGEPSWESPWGKGRPGWHIECSVMASDILGADLDIHTGGEDLKFPHHDNECAQCEAHDNTQQWCNYFFHAGHLHISGLKMSKSLKNFFTIREILEQFTPRQLRILFLLNGWAAKMNYNDDTIEETRAYEKTFMEFDANVGIDIRNTTFSVNQKWTPEERKLYATIASHIAEVDGHLKNDLNYADAMKSLKSMIGTVNAYRAGTKEPKVYLLKKARDFLRKMLNIFGVTDGGAGLSGSAEVEEAIQPLLDALTDCRSKVREAALGDPNSLRQNLDGSLNATKELLASIGVTIGDDECKIDESYPIQSSSVSTQARVQKVGDVFATFFNKAAASSDKKTLLMLCDDVRDDKLLYCGVQLEDQDEGSVWKLRNANDLLRERDRKEKEQKVDDAMKALNNSLKQLDDLMKKRDQLTVYRPVTDDPKQLPSEQLGDDGQWAVIGKKSLKKLKKRWSKMHANVAAFKQQIQENPNMLNDLTDAVKRNLDTLEGLAGAFSASALKEKQEKVRQSLEAASQGSDS